MRAFQVLHAHAQADDAALLRRGRLGYRRQRKSGHAIGHRRRHTKQCGDAQELAPGDLAIGQLGARVSDDRMQFIGHTNLPGSPAVMDGKPAARISLVPGHRHAQEVDECRRERRYAARPLTARRAEHLFDPDRAGREQVVCRGGRRCRLALAWLRPGSGLPGSCRRVFGRWRRGDLPFRCLLLRHIRRRRWGAEWHTG